MLTTVGSAGVRALAEPRGLRQFGSGVVNLRAPTGASTSEKKAPERP